MWLISTFSLLLTEFHGDDIPSYAILSHCWDKDPSNEVSFQDFRKSRNTESSGMKKIVDFCRIAAQEYQLNWAWVDTCCIDKKSSAHLSEAINSMYRYYNQASKCCVYLNDFNGDNVEKASWRDSKWWTRGWTLQELLAPEIVHFYDAEWEFIGSKTTFADHIAGLTGISIFMIYGELPSRVNFTAGQRLSWAAQRSTSRVEDRAYSLLGLFNIHMPLLYGERESAFRRLQQEILSSSSDESILAWSCDVPSSFAVTAMNSLSYSSRTWSSESVLADSPDRYRHNSRVLLVRDSEAALNQRSRPPAITSWGIELSSTAKQLIATSDFYKHIGAIHGLPPLLIIPLVVSSAEKASVLSCVLILAPTQLRGRYGRLCCISERFSKLKDATFYKPFFTLDDTHREVTLYLKT